MGKTIQDTPKLNQAGCLLAPSQKIHADNRINVKIQAPEIYRARKVYTIAVFFPAGAYQFSVHKSKAKIGARQMP